MNYLLRALRAGYRFVRGLLSPERSTDERLRQSVKDAEAEAEARRKGQ